jgi:DNA uptake protein ComE-like DNA-binding protein
VEPQPAEEEAEEEGSGSPGLIGRILGTGGAEPEAAEAEEETPEAEPQEEKSEEAEAPSGEEGAVDLNKASFEQLRDLGFSVTQATRLLTYRERQGGFESLDDVKDVPGMSDELLAEVGPKLRVG